MTWYQKRLRQTTNRILIQIGIDLGYSDSEIIEAIYSDIYQSATLSRVIGEVRTTKK
jgi:hypothetical protein